MWNQFRKQWRILSGGAIWVFGIVATFVAPPYFLDEHWIRFVRFIITVLMGLLLILTTNFAAKVYTLTWVSATCILLVASIASYFTYDTLAWRWSVPYYTGRALIGATYTEFANFHRETLKSDNGHYPTDEQLVRLNAGTSLLWPDTEIESRRIYLSVLYTGNVVCFSCCIITLMQAIACNSKRRPAKQLRK